MENKSSYTKKTKEEEDDEVNNGEEISILKDELQKKEEQIIKLEKELELKNLKINLNSNPVEFPRKENYLGRDPPGEGEASKIRNDNNPNVDKIFRASSKTMKTNSKDKERDINMNIGDIKNQISELNQQLKMKKDLLNKIRKEKKEIKSNSYNNWRKGGQGYMTDDLRGGPDKNSSEKNELKKLIKSKNKEINQLKFENKNNKEENSILQTKINEINQEINKIMKENSQIKKEQNFLNKDIEEIRKNNEKLNAENSALRERIQVLNKYDLDNRNVIKKLREEIEALNNKISDYLKEKEQLLIKINNLVEENKKISDKNKELTSNKSGNADFLISTLKCNKKVAAENTNGYYYDYDNNLFKCPRNCGVRNNNTYLNYSHFANCIAHKTNHKLFHNDVLINNSSYMPMPNTLIKNKSFKIEKEEEKVNFNKQKKDMSSLNNQIFQLESQIDALQKQVVELNSQNKNFDKDKKKLKNYEKIIETERFKNLSAEKCIYRLQQEMEILKKNYNNNINNLTAISKNKNKFKGDKDKGNIPIRIVRSNTDRKKFLSKNASREELKNSNDITFRNEEKSAVSTNAHNRTSSSNKLKGSDIDFCYNKQILMSNTNEY